MIPYRRFGFTFSRRIRNKYSLSTLSFDPCKETLSINQCQYTHIHTHKLIYIYTALLYTCLFDHKVIGSILQVFESTVLF